MTKVDLIPIGRCCVQDRSGIRGDSAEGVALPFVGLEHIAAHAGRISISHDSGGKSVGTNFLFDERHVLYGKLRPYLNKVALPDFSGRCSTELIPLLPCEGVDREYLAFALRSPRVVSFAVKHSAGSRMPRAKLKNLFQLKIPLPPLSEQRRIVARLRQELQNCDEICRAAESRIDRIRALFSAWVRIVFDKFERASWVKFSDIAEINPRRGSFGGRLKNEDMATFIPMSAVDSTAGEVSSPLVRPFSEVCKGYTFFRDGDVLFAKITPCMQNGNHFVAKNGINGFGFASTEFYVIRSGNMVLPEWIHLFIRQPSILRAAMRQFRGSAGQQRVPPKFLADLRIPLPPIPRQRRIVAQARDQFQDWQKLTTSANTQLESARALPQAFLRRAFS